MKIKGTTIDLSQEIYTGMPVYPGHAKTVIWEHRYKDGEPHGLCRGYWSDGTVWCEKHYKDGNW